MQHYQLEELEARRAQSGQLYFEFVREAAMSCGLYALPASSADPQQPHSEDEVYVVLRGKAQIRVADEDAPVQAGSVVYVPAHVKHRFHSIEEDLEVIVLFAPAEYSRQGT